MFGLSDEVAAVHERRPFERGGPAGSCESRCACVIDPLRDPRWPAFLDRQVRASVFHRPEWLAALQRTYGYEPVVFTTSPPGRPLENGFVFCRVESWLTGSRLVSLPFSDHCQPLADSPADWAALSGAIQQHLADQHEGYVEVRPVALNENASAALTAFAVSEQYCFHQLDLRPDLSVIFSGFHKDCIQRKIERAERERLTYEAGRSESILERFYQLLQLTRRRHRLPPQPITWFRNLIDCLGENATIHVAHKNGQPVASILTLHYKRTAVYKYGCSDARFHNLGAMPWLLWGAIQDAKRNRAEEFDLGRSDHDNAGLIAFKDHLGAPRSTLSYYRYPSSKAAIPNAQRVRRIVRSALPLMPDSMLRMAGKLLYKHVG